MSEHAESATTVVDVDAGIEHVDAVVAVMHAAFAEYSDRGEPSGALLETPGSLREEMEGGVRVALVRLDGEVVATVKHRPSGDGTLTFGRLAIVPGARGRGLASALLEALRTTARDTGLSGLSCSVRAAEPRNVAIYEHLGMAVVGRGAQRSLTGAVIPVVLMRDP
ncbi:Acetyltransferase (GNAT) family protein [Paraoerskovia marina]|uniref:Acetyltransferase (GNAT) family protein n=1 Tax=Paraoerskovia marina TaxID=545619 RepID=A0A1H1SZB6_9CELL|nr:GNAT family N-acetyltransferase [Paraoerskovia marina]SDS53387.1 Acetyltransferase (GNAT) family protein [Paraoerskovia marina]